MCVSLSVCVCVCGPIVSIRVCGLYSNGLPTTNPPTHPQPQQKADDGERVSEDQLRLLVAGAQKSGGIEAQEGQMINQVLNMQVRTSGGLVCVLCCGCGSVCICTHTRPEPPDRPLPLNPPLKSHTLTPPHPGPNQHIACIDQP